MPEGTDGLEEFVARLEATMVAIFGAFPFEEADHGSSRQVLEILFLDSMREPIMMEGALFHPQICQADVEVRALFMRSFIRFVAFQKIEFCSSPSKSLVKVCFLQMLEDSILCSLKKTAPHFYADGEILILKLGLMGRGRDRPFWVEGSAKKVLTWDMVAHELKAMRSVKDYLNYSETGDEEEE